MEVLFTTVVLVLINCLGLITLMRRDGPVIQLARPARFAEISTHLLNATRINFAIT